MTVKVDDKKVLAALERAPRVFKKEVRKEMKTQMTDVATRAQKHHRFNSQSHDLEHSVLVGKNLKWHTGSVYLDDGIAKYGKFIHEGFKSWRRDRFLYKSFLSKRKQIVRELDKAIMRGFKLVGLK